MPYTILDCPHDAVKRLNRRFTTIISLKFSLILPCLRDFAHRLEPSSAIDDDCRLSGMPPAMVMLYRSQISLFSITSATLSGRLADTANGQRNP